MPDGTRRFRKIGLGVPKKNGKSTMLSALSIYLMLADGEGGAEIYSAAADRNQASIIYNEAASMVEASPHLSKVLKVRRSGKRIEHNASKSSYHALSAEAYTKEGLNIHGLLFDELHTQSNDELWNTLRYGGRARRQPMYWWISTAGEKDETSLWWDQWEQARAIQNSTAVDISYHGVIYEATAADDWTSEATWKKANPSYGITLQPRQIREEAEEAKRNPSAKMSFFRYTLNIPTAAESEWLPVEEWNQCGANYTLADLKGADCYGGLDLASTTDLIAYVMVFKKDGLIWLWPTFWIPSKQVKIRESSNKQKYNKWIEQGHLKATDDPVADYKVIRNDILTLLRKIETDKVLIDRWNATQLAKSLESGVKKKGLSTKVQYARYSTSTVSAATKELERLILSTRLRHPNNPVLTWMFQNVIIKMDTFGNKMPDKERSKDKIDGIAAATLALATMIEDAKVTSAYETEGIFNAGHSHAS